MKKIMFCFVIICFAVMFCSIGTFADVPIRCEMDFKIGDFIYLRDAVSAENESGIVEFFNRGTPHHQYDEGMIDFVNVGCSWGKSVMRILDQLVLLDFDCDHEEMEDRILTLESYSFGKGTGGVYMEYELPQGIYVQCQYLTTVKENSSPSPEFVLKTKEGGEIPFVKWNANLLSYRGYYLPEGGKTVIITIYFPAEMKNLDALVEGIGELSFVSFRELTSGEDINATVPHADGGITAFPWLWVGIGGGAAVVIGGAVAAALILRKKRRKAVDVEN